MESHEMRLTTLLLIAIFIAGTLTESAADVHALHSVNKVTLYGDYCNRVSHYGMHHKAISDKGVRQSLEHYFSKKGLDFEILNAKGRFIKALIKDGNKNVDIIIFDRHTGRIRSIY
jgi:hypothetical protein